MADPCSNMSECLHAARLKALSGVKSDECRMQGGDELGILVCSAGATGGSGREGWGQNIAGRCLPSRIVLEISSVSEGWVGGKRWATCASAARVAEIKRR